MPTEVDLLSPHASAAADLTSYEINMEMWGRIHFTHNAMHDILYT